MLVQKICDCVEGPDQNTIRDDGRFADDLFVLLLVRATTSSKIFCVGLVDPCENGETVARCKKAEKEAGEKLNHQSPRRHKTAEII
jgi:hypothetical protein